MVQRELIITDPALKDLYQLDYAIRYTYQAPLTAQRYLTGLKQAIHKLSNSADLHIIQAELSLKYKIEIRRENYKEMAILFSIANDKVYIHRIIPQSVVK